jgi:hypothetical protein
MRRTQINSTTPQAIVKSKKTTQGAAENVPVLTLPAKNSTRKMFMLKPANLLKNSTWDSAAYRELNNNTHFFFILNFKLNIALHDAVSTFARCAPSKAFGHCGLPWGLHGACADWLWAPRSAVDNHPVIQDNLKY